MEFNSISFFCDKGRQPTCSMGSGEYYKHIELSENFNSVYIYVKDESDLIAFKNSVAYAYKEYKEKRDSAKVERLDDL